MDYEKLAKLLFPNVTETAEEVEARYPQRDLPEGAKVTRITPSPTGFMHLGNLFGAITDERLAHQSGGVFFLRIEDTDAKRAVEGGVETIISVFKKFGLNFDEGALIDGEKGDYGPYRQRQRASIYHVFAKKLVSEGKAYPCFCTEEDLAAMREQQEAEKANPGYYGKWAAHRDMPLEEVEKALEEGKSWVLRFRSEGNIEKYLHLNDLVKGKIDMPENDQDVVLLKSDGIPTYHFAHVVDDHLMKTTHVVRGEEWLATWSIHVQLFSALGWKMPKYVHTAQLMKMDGESKRKLSKRKDPELALDFYFEEGYPVPSVIEYLLTLLNSNFEEWRLANPKEPYENFKFTTNKMSVSGSLFDLDKLRDVSKNVVAMLTTEKVWEYFSDWAEKYDNEFYQLLARDPEYAKSIISIGRGVPKPRKDIAVWSEMKDYMAFFYDELFVEGKQYPESMSTEDIAAVLKNYADIYDEHDDQTEWFNKIKELSVSMGYAASPKEFKQNPEAFKGHVGDISAVIRMAVTGRVNSPDMFTVMNILGKEKVLERLEKALKAL
ncbi:MAG: glutamate--tRNA ligase [Oscillospiraceae bacterium]|nr:glutamate--tRNA ligase [Oscillospiraceae bacterium]